MKLAFLLGLGLLIVFLGITGRMGTVLMATFYPSNMVVSGGGSSGTAQSKTQPPTATGQLQPS